MSDFETSFRRGILNRLNDPVLLSETNAYRAFAGVFEAEPSITVDIFDRAGVIHQSAETPPVMIPFIKDTLLRELPNLDTLILKQRKAKDPSDRNGIFLIGENPNVEIREYGVRYAVNLTMNHDTGFYLDTALLRKWLIDHAAGKRVLNTFAYTGSLGVSALCGGAASVIQQDKSKVFLNFARKSTALNQPQSGTASILTQDFFPATANFRKQKREFEIVLLDPPFFSTTAKGLVSIEQGYLSLINKVRPLVADQGILVLINNALFLSGQDLLRMIEPIFLDGYITIQESVSVPASFIGYHPNPGELLPADPSPFEHSTKILILKVAKK